MMASIASEAWAFCITDSNCPSPSEPWCLGICVGCTLNSHCTRFTATPLCHVATGICVQCLSDSNCLSTAAVKCSAANTCVPCTDSSQCSSRFPLTPICKSPGPAGTCVECVTDADCSTATKAKCSTANTCVPCTENIQCSNHLPETPYCKTSNGKCVECLDHENCPSIETSRCSSSNTCTTCLLDSQCERFPTTPICYINMGGKCIPCYSDSHCPSPTAPKCENYTCGACTTNSQCSRFNPKKKCSSSGKCVECLTNDDCTGGKICSGSGICSICLSSSECVTPPFLICNTEVGLCTECEYNTDCNLDPARSQCSTSGSCMACAESIHCEHLTSTPFCSAGVCVQCISDSDCPNPDQAKCSGNACVACTDSSNCAHLTSTPVCTLPTGLCVECASDSDCLSPTAARCSSNTCMTCTDSTQCERWSSTPVCATGVAAGTCVECNTHIDCLSAYGSQCLSDHTCAPCTDTSHCLHLPTTHVCNTILNGLCVECNLDSDCSSLTAAQCSSSNICVPCTDSTHCEHLTATPVCGTGTAAGKCVKCNIDSDCLSASASQCSTSNTCIPCAVSSQCAHLPATPLCSTTLGGGCVQCDTDSDCTSTSTAHCSSATNTCVSCTDSTQCARFSSTPVCDTTIGTCVECIADADCPSAAVPKCSPTNNTCVPCYQYQNTCYISCPNGTSPNSANYTCIATCKASSDCIAAADKTRPECNGTICVACSTDAECQQWYSQIEMTCNITSGACKLVVDPVIETFAAVASTVTTSAVIAVSGAATISTFASAGSASRGFSTLRITKLAALVRYININAPHQAEKLFEGFTRAQTFIKTMLVGLFDSEQYNQTMNNLPKRFMKFEDSSLFLKNAGMPVLISVAVGLAVLACRIGLQKARKKRSRTWTKRLLNIRNILEWNYILGTVAGSYSDLILGFGLQIYDLPFSNPTPLSLISFVICVFVTPVAILFPLICPYLMSAKKKSRNHRYHNISKYEIFIADFKENNGDTKVYQMVGLLRIQAMVFPLIFWQHNPLAQILFMIVGSIAVNILHITKVSYKSKFTNFVILANEVLLFISMIGVLLNIACSSAGINPDNSKTINVAGWIITCSLTFLMVFNAIISLVGVLKYIWNGVKSARNRSKAPPKRNPNSNPYTYSVRRQVSPSANDPALSLSQRNQALSLSQRSQALSGSRIDIDIQTSRRTKRRFERVENN